jgi:8-oxo-dGTP diphosphatase
VTSDRISVVGAAIVRDGRVLAARRTTPPVAAGRWEFPGGKVEEGETPEQALVRELTEELGVAARVEGWLPGVAVIGERHQLTVAVVGIDGEPVPHEHDAVRWLAAQELDDVDWLDPDRPFLPGLRAHLAERHDQAG